MPMRRKPLPAWAVLCFVLWGLQGVHGNDKAQPTEPELRSHHPLGGAIGTPFEIRVRGKRLQGVRTVWFEREDVRARVLTVEEIKESGAVRYSSVVIDKEVCKLSVVGIGMRSQSGVAARMFKALANEGINILVIATSEIKISVLVDRKYMELGVQALHDAFELHRQ